MIYQIHFNRQFYIDKKTGYWISSDYPRIRAHRWVWINVHGNIPKGYHIHHKDENKSNNTIENLELVEAGRHIRHHITDEKREKARRLVEYIRPLTKKWHASKEGRQWHKAHGLMCWIKRKEFKIICKLCCKEAITKTYHQTFCSDKCKSKWRRDNKIDDETRSCERCESSFTCNKYSKKKFCNNH